MSDTRTPEMVADQCVYSSHRAELTVCGHVTLREARKAFAGVIREAEERGAEQAFRVLMAVFDAQTDAVRKAHDILQAHSKQTADVIGALAVAHTVKKLRAKKRSKR